ncbi:hypothetical protein BLL52_1736 [Rhodoferax antarcticus ANT.BR]|uniref:Uncharacterized protein n=1 Tax=Rhodoferax antarcticus ANT.BR TaxID=1111071 RepID=A0A1Q8YGD2_9BURK|nr:hypothetical protein BLL52_1736 [Rhodoferax antarcticus ANT.BR]
MLYSFRVLTPWFEFNKLGLPGVNDSFDNIRTESESANKCVGADRVEPSAAPWKR